jgi:hypothetical protein
MDAKTEPQKGPAPAPPTRRPVHAKAGAWFRKWWKHIIIVAGGLTAIGGAFAAFLSAEPQVMDLAKTLVPYVSDNGDMAVEFVKELPNHTCLYRVSYPVTYKNGAVVDVDISYMILEIYTASQPDIEKTVGVYLGAEPPLFQSDQQRGPMSWQLKQVLFTTDKTAKRELIDDVAKRTGAHPDTLNAGKDGITGRLRAGRSTQVPYWFFLRASPEDYIGMVVISGLDGNASLDDDKKQVIDEDISAPKYEMVGDKRVAVCDRGGM